MGIASASATHAPGTVPPAPVRSGLRWRKLTPYLLLLPGLLWLASSSSSRCWRCWARRPRPGGQRRDRRVRADLPLGQLQRGAADLRAQFLRSFVYAGIATCWPC